MGGFSMTVQSGSAEKITIIGAGLAGSEAALQLAKWGIQVTLYDLKPSQLSPAHHNAHIAEIVCSNSLGSQGSTTASGLLKQELEALDCQLLAIAQQVAVPAGKALAVDRDAFAASVHQRVMVEKNITFISQDVQEIPLEDGIVLVASGPMTSEGLTNSLSRLLNREQLYFFDAASPIIAKDSINFDIAFVQDRYGLEKQSAEDHAEVASYINCPLEKEHYMALVQKLIDAEKIPLKSFEKEQNAKFFEQCLPVEVLASRGVQTLRFGPMKPIGLIDPRTGKAPYGVVQLRQDNREGTLYNVVGFQTNLKWGEQKEMLQGIPGLENAEIVRYGVMHRNTYIHSPEVLLPTLQLKKFPHVFIAGQLTGTEGYTESIASGLLAALNMARLFRGETPQAPPRAMMLGALMHYITREEAVQKAFQPINSNWGILPELPEKVKDKASRNQAYVDRALQSLNHFHSREEASALPAC
jgi:methylenetetrahydrofolate--tRNA-(uracil-5-)-methyltransferase